MVVRSKPPEVLHGWGVGVACLPSLTPGCAALAHRRPAIGAAGRPAEALPLAATEGSAFIQRRHFDRAVQETVHGVRESRPRSQGRHTVPLD